MVKLLGLVVTFQGHCVHCSLWLIAIQKLIHSLGRTNHRASSGPGTLQFVYRKTYTVINNCSKSPASILPLPSYKLSKLPANQMRFAIRFCTWKKPSVFCSSAVSSHKKLRRKTVESQMLREDWMAGKNHLSYYQLCRQENGYKRSHWCRRITNSVQRIRRWTYFSHAYLHCKDAGDPKQVLMVRWIWWVPSLRRCPASTAPNMDTKFVPSGRLANISSKIERISDATSLDADISQRENCAMLRLQAL